MAGPGIERYGNPFVTGLEGNDTLGDFARQVILHQPLDYAREIGKEMLRFIEPSIGYDRPYAGAGPDELDLARRTPGAEEVTIQRAHEVGFEAGPIEVDDSIHVLQDIQRVLRVIGAAMLLLLALAVCAIVLGRGLIRRAAILFAGVAVLQALVPVATISGGFRYTIPSLGFLAAAAALGLAAFADRAQTGQGLAAKVG